MISGLLLEKLLAGLWNLLFMCPENTVEERKSFGSFVFFEIMAHVQGKFSEISGLKVLYVYQCNILRVH